MPWLEITKDFLEFPHKHTSKVQNSPTLCHFFSPRMGVFLPECPGDLHLPEGSAEIHLSILSLPSKDREVKAECEALPGFELPLQYFARTHLAWRNLRIIWLGTRSFTVLKFLGNFHWNLSSSNKSLLLSFVQMQKHLRSVRLA